MLTLRLQSYRCGSVWSNSKCRFEINPPKFPGYRSSPFSLRCRGVSRVNNLFGGKKGTVVCFFLIMLSCFIVQCSSDRGAVNESRLFSSREEGGGVMDAWRKRREVRGCRDKEKSMFWLPGHFLFTRSRGGGGRESTFQ